MPTRWLAVRIRRGWMARARSRCVSRRAHRNSSQRPPCVSPLLAMRRAAVSRVLLLRPCMQERAWSFRPLLRAWAKVGHGSMPLRVADRGAERRRDGERDAERSCLPGKARVVQRGWTRGRLESRRCLPARPSRWQWLRGAPGTPGYRGCGWPLSLYSRRATGTSPGRQGCCGR